MLKIPVLSRSFPNFAHVSRVEEFCIMALNGYGVEIQSDRSLDLKKNINTSYSNWKSAFCKYAKFGENVSLVSADCFAPFSPVKLLKHRRGDPFFFSV